MFRLTHHYFALGALLGLSLLPRLAVAQECSDANSCPDGFTCETSTSADCPAIACAPNTDCVQPDCTPQSYSYCTANECDPDGAAAECGADMVCYTRPATQVCSTSGGMACPDGQMCPEPEPAEPDCTTVPAESYCTYKYSLPCTEAADCGDGFDCVASEMVTCAGSAPTGMGGGTDPSMGTATAVVDAGVVGLDTGAPVMGECTTTFSDLKYCQVIEVMCETDADCTIESWTCQDLGGVTAGCAVTDPPMMVDPSAGSGGAASSDPSRPAPAVDGGAPTPYDDCTMEPVAVIKQCMPAGYVYFAATGGVARDDSGSVTLGAPESPTPTGGTPQMGSGPGDVNSNAESGSGSSDSGGCSFGRTPASGAAGFMGLLLGLATMVARRRK